MVLDSTTAKKCCLVLSCRFAPPTAARDPPIAGSDQFEQWFVYNDPTAWPHPSQDPTNSVNGLYITKPQTRHIHRTIRPFQSLACKSRTARRDPPIARSDQFTQWLQDHDPPVASLLKTMPESSCPKRPSMRSPSKLRRNSKMRVACCGSWPLAHTSDVKTISLSLLSSAIANSFMRAWSVACTFVSFGCE